MENNRYLMYLEVDEEKLDQIFEKLHDAERTILDCYQKLLKVGVVKIKGAIPEESPSE